MRVRSTWLAPFSVGVLVLLTTAWANGSSAVAPPKCSPADNARAAVLTSGKGAYNSPLYIRACGPARAVVRLLGKTYVIRGGSCERQALDGQPLDHRILRGVNIGLLANRPARPALGVSFWWVKSLSTAGRIKAQESAIQVPGVRVDGAGFVFVTVAKGLNSGTFSFVDRLTDACDRTLQLRLTQRR